MYTKLYLLKEYPFRSDTDSGRSSAPSDHHYNILNQQILKCPTKDQHSQTLKVTRRNSAVPNVTDNLQKFNTIGHRVKSVNAPAAEPPVRLQVKRKKDEIIKKRNSYRRNTIAVNSVDIEKAKESTTLPLSRDLTKSTNFIDKACDLSQQNNIVNGASMPGNKFNN